MPRINTMNSLENKLISRFSTGYRPPKFINRLVLPPIPVEKDTGRYLVDLNGNLIYDAERAPRAEAKQVNFNISYGNWAVNEYALGMHLDNKEISAAKSSGAQKLVDLKKLASRKLINLLELKREKVVADIVGGTSYYDNDFQKALTNGEEWSDEDSDPIGDIMTGMNKVRSQVGFMPNAMVMGRQTYNVLAVHPQLISYFKNQMGRLTLDQIKSLFEGIDQIIIGDGVYNSGTEDSPTITDFWGDMCALYIIPSMAELEEGTQVHAAMFDKLVDYMFVENPYKYSLGIEVTQSVTWGAQHISDKNGYLITNTVADA